MSSEKQQFREGHVGVKTRSMYSTLNGQFGHTMLGKRQRDQTVVALQGATTKEVEEALLQEYKKNSKELDQIVKHAKSKFDLRQVQAERLEQSLAFYKPRTTLRPDSGGPLYNPDAPITLRLQQLAQSAKVSIDDLMNQEKHRFDRENVLLQSYFNREKRFQKVEGILTQTLLESKKKNLNEYLKDLMFKNQKMKFNQQQEEMFQRRFYEEQMRKQKTQEDLLRQFYKQQQSTELSPYQQRQAIAMASSTTETVVQATTSLAQFLRQGENYAQRMQEYEQNVQQMQFVPEEVPRGAPVQVRRLIRARNRHGRAQAQEQINALQVPVRGEWDQALSYVSFLANAIGSAANVGLQNILFAVNVYQLYDYIIANSQRAWSGQQQFADQTMQNLAMFIPFEDMQSFRNNLIYQITADANVIFQEAYLQLPVDGTEQPINIKLPFVQFLHQDVMINTCAMTAAQFIYYVMYADQEGKIEDALQVFEDEQFQQLYQKCLEQAKEKIPAIAKNIDQYVVKSIDEMIVNAAAQYLVPEQYIVIQDMLEYSRTKLTGSTLLKMDKFQLYCEPSITDNLLYYLGQNKNVTISQQSLIALQSDPQKRFDVKQVQGTQDYVITADDITHFQAINRVLESLNTKRLVPNYTVMYSTSAIQPYQNNQMAEGVGNYIQIVGTEAIVSHMIQNDAPGYIETSWFFRRMVDWSKQAQVDQLGTRIDSANKFYTAKYQGQIQKIEPISILTQLETSSTQKQRIALFLFFFLSTYHNVKLDDDPAVLKTKYRQIMAAYTNNDELRQVAQSEFLKIKPGELQMHLQSTTKYKKMFGYDKAAIMGALATFTVLLQKNQ